MRAKIRKELPTQAELASELEKQVQAERTSQLIFSPLDMYQQKHERQMREIEKWSCQSDWGWAFDKIDTIADKKNLALMLSNEVRYLQLQQLTKADMGFNTPREYLIETTKLFFDLYIDHIDFLVAETARDDFYGYDKNGKIAQHVIQPRQYPKIFSSKFVRQQLKTMAWGERKTAIILVPIAIKRNAINPQNFTTGNFEMFTFGDFMMTCYGDYLVMDKLSPIWSKI